jgi:hypothetical protein
MILSVYLTVRIKSLRLNLKMSSVSEITGRNLQIKIDENMICYDYLKSQSSPSIPPIVYLPGMKICVYK